MEEKAKILPAGDERKNIFGLEPMSSFRGFDRAAARGAIARRGEAAAYPSKPINEDQLLIIIQEHFNTSRD
jgi:hypothetical protein